MTANPDQTPALTLPLTTRRLTIREYAEEDWSAVYSYVKDPAYWKYQAGEAPTEERVKALIEWTVREQSLKPRLNYYLAVTESKSGTLIGEAVLKAIPPGHRQGEIGFGIAPAHWKKGYATEVAKALVAAGFETLGLHRISSQCAPQNKASIRIMQKLGMAREGLFREHYQTGGKYWSTVFYAILSRENEKFNSNRNG